MKFSTHSLLLSQIKIKYWSLLWQRPLFFFTPQYTTFYIFKYISHFETITNLSSASGLGSLAFLLNFKNNFNYENVNMLVWQLENIFSTEHTNLCDWLRMLCLRASDHVWTELSQVMTSIHLYRDSTHWLLHSAHTRISYWILHYISCNIHSALFYTYPTYWLMVTKTLIRAECLLSENRMWTQHWIWQHSNTCI